MSVPDKTIRGFDTHRIWHVISEVWMLFYHVSRWVPCFPAELNCESCDYTNLHSACKNCADVKLPITSTHQYSLQIYLPWHPWSIWLILFTSIPTNSCTGVCANMQPNSKNHSTNISYRPWPLPSRHPHSIVGKSDLLIRLPPPQRFRRIPESSSKVPLTHVSNSRQKGNVSKSRTGQSGRGTYRVSPTWAAFFLVPNLVTNL